ncbi:MAG: TraU family protein [Sulfurimonadaceae bacterium]|jgi:conjugal transfer pilus assembly protein TraU|nr:TraU family protein [Sulfurimonadaceae bacterium]
MKKLLTNAFLTIFFSVTLFGDGGQAGTPAASAACKAATKGSSSATQILTNTYSSVLNILPIRIGGVQTVPGMGTEDYVNYPISYCVCPKPWPMPGVPLEYWQPNSIIDVSNIPNCIPTFGMSMPIAVVAGSSFQEINKSNTQNKESYQITYIKYPLLSIFGMFADSMCQTSDTSIDFGYFSTIDPLWQNDMWSILVNPDAFLFANPIAQFACIADALTSMFGFSLDPLYWCFGSWNQTFPLTKATTGVTSPESAMAIAARTLFKLHRQFMLMGSIGPTGICGSYPMPIMAKSQYNMYPIYPLMTWPYRIPIGRTGFIWSAGQDAPVVNSHVWSIITYKKRTCCAF